VQHSTVDGLSWYVCLSLHNSKQYSWVLVLPHSVSVQLFVFNLTYIHFIIASGRAELNEICVLFYVILYMMIRDFL
jgi:hypothetical protein